MPGVARLEIGPAAGKTREIRQAWTKAGQSVPKAAIGPGGERCSALACGVCAACVTGNRACRRPFRPPSNRPLTQFVRIFPASCLAGILRRSPRNSSGVEYGGLKGRLQARLPATRKAKPEVRAQLTWTSQKHIPHEAADLTVRLSLVRPARVGSLPASIVRRTPPWSSSISRGEHSPTFPKRRTSAPSSRPRIPRHSHPAY